MDVIDPFEDVKPMLGLENDMDIRVNESIFAEDGFEVTENECEEQENVIDAEKGVPQPEPEAGQFIRDIESAIYNCQFCKKNIRGVNGLDTHLRKVHNAKISYTCHICQLKIWRVSLLKRHLRCHENKELKKSGQNPKCSSKQKRISKQKGNKSTSEIDISNDAIVDKVTVNNFRSSQAEISSQQQQISTEPPDHVNEDSNWADFDNDDGGPNHDDWGWDTDVLMPESRLSDLSWISNVPTVNPPKIVEATSVGSSADVLIKEAVKFPCTICSEVFYSKQFYEIHKSYHNLQISVDLKCLKCDTYFSTVEAYTLHATKSHKPRRRGAFNRYVTDSARKSMAKMKYNKKKSVSCKQCGHLVRSQFELTIHMQRHTGIKLFSCIECGASFSAPASLKRHQRAHQVALLELGMGPESPPNQSAEEDDNIIKLPKKSRITDHGKTLRNLTKVRYSTDSLASLVRKQVKCTICDHVSRSNTELLLHMQNHTGTKMFKCYTCETNFSSRNSLIRHIRLAHEDIRPHPCNHCGKNFPSLSDLKSHQRYHALGKRYKCTFGQCERRFALRTHLLDHIRRHTGERPYSCQKEKCGRTFMSNTELRRHEKAHLTTAFVENSAIPVADSSTAYQYPCPECDRGFNTLERFKIHRKIHDPNRKTYLCDLCGKKYFTKASLVYHSITHEEEKNIPCPTCFKKFQTPYSLAIHEKYHHAKLRSFKITGEQICEVCGKKFKSAYGLKIHMERHEQKKYICDQCGKECSTRGDLKFHKYTHLTVKPFKCEFCDYRCTHPSNINHHVAQDHMGYTIGVFKEIVVEGKEKSFICFTCGEGWMDEKAFEHHRLYHEPPDIRCKKCPEYFNTKYDLWIHAKAHRPSASIVLCSYCSKPFNSRASRKSHERYNHTGETPYGCSSCDRRFKSRQDLRYHTYTHTGNYPFSCSVCGKRARSKGNLNAHMRTHQKGTSASSSKPPTRVKCQLCDESFKTRSLLKKHSSTHHPPQQQEVEEDLNDDGVNHSIIEHIEIPESSSSLSAQPHESIQTVTIENRIQGAEQPAFQLNYSQFFTSW